MSFASQRLLSLLADRDVWGFVSPQDDLESLVKSFLALRYPQIADRLHMVPEGNWQALVDIWQPWVDAHPQLFGAARAGAYGSVAAHLLQLLPSL